MAEPITHLEQTIAGQVEPVTHLEQVIAEYGGGDINEQLEAGTNIVIEPTADGKAKISASGEVSSEDTYARGEISDHKADKANPHEVTAAQVGLGNVNNTSDANKPISTATQAALDLKANLTDIPTVNDATITIQKNGTKVDDFTLNAASGKTINITVPTTAADVSALPASTKYAGAASAGGSATSAAKLDTSSAGSATQPVYFANGVPTATTYSLEKSVPSNAVFTDTTYAFEGTYDATTNKAATMADIKDGLLTGYAQGSGNVAATDKVAEAIGKVEKKADDNKNNILKKNWNFSKARYVATAANTWENIIDLYITIPPLKKAFITVTGKYNNFAVKGVALSISDTFDYANCIACIEPTNDLNAVTATAVFENLANANATIVPYVKLSNSGGNGDDVWISYRLLDD